MVRLKAVVAALGLTLVLVCACQAQTPPPQPVPLVLTNVRVIDVTGAAPPAPGMTVVIAGERIREIGRGESVRVPSGTRSRIRRRREP